MLAYLQSDTNTSAEGLCRCYELLVKLAALKVQRHRAAGHVIDNKYTKKSYI